MVPFFSPDTSGKDARLLSGGAPAMTAAPAAPTTSTVERRAAKRFDTRFGAFFHPLLGNGSFYSARVKNISRRGITLLSHRPFESACRLIVLLSKAVEVRVIHSTATPQGHWLLGCAFSYELEEEALSALLAKHEKAGAAT